MAGWRLRPSRRLVAAWILGLLAGAAVVQAHDRWWLHRLAEQNRLAGEEVARLRDETARLRQQLTVAGGGGGRRLVRQVSVTTLNPRVPLADVRAALEPLTSALIGLPVEQISPELLWPLFNGRVVTIRGRLYRVEVQVIVVASEVRLLLNIVPAAGPPGSAGNG
jgi:hypothetical protein